MRNRLVHEYDDIDLDTVWETVKTSLPVLVIELEKVLVSDSNLVKQLKFYFAHFLHF